MIFFYTASSHQYLAMLLDLFLNSKYFSKNLHFSDFELFCDQYSSSTVSTFNYLRVATAQWNFLLSFLSLIPRNVFVFISKFHIFFDKLYTSWKKFAIGTALSWRVLSSGDSPIQFSIQLLLIKVLQCIRCYF